ncbi:MAG: glycosyltransferase family 2 protein [Chloroflexota bacterium]|nr:glycosyltransferase family 2 protein [Chloroflexota bacterium]
MQTLAVIIVSWNVRELLDRCLASLQAELARNSLLAQVWVVDNASADSSEKMVREEHPWVNLEPLEENRGFVGGNNHVLQRLLRKELPDFVWLLNPDTEVRPHALTALLDFLNQHPRAGLIGPQLLNSNGSVQQSAFRFPGLLQLLFELELLPRRFYQTRWNGRYSRHHYAKRRPFPIDFPLGAAMLARGRAIHQVGPLDKRFFMYCEEIDWAWRMREAGWQNWLVPAAEVVHYGGASSGQARPQTTAHLWESRARLYRKHHRRYTYRIASTLVRHYFAHQKAISAAWEETHARIIAAWR